MKELAQHATLALFIQYSTVMVLFIITVVIMTIIYSYLLGVFQAQNRYAIIKYK